MKTGSTAKYRTLPDIRRRTGVGLHTLRRAAAEGKFALYSFDGAWPRANEREVHDWIETTRISPQQEDLIRSPLDDAELDYHPRHPEGERRPENTPGGHSGRKRI